MKKIVLLSITFIIQSILMLSCKAEQIMTYDYMQNINASHQVKNEIILKPINKLIKESKADKSLNIINIYIDSINENKYNIYFRLSNFSTEQAIRQVYKNKPKPKGYLVIDKVPIIIYDDDDVDKFFKKISSPQDILETNREIELLIDVDTSYKHYVYTKYLIYDNLEEYITYKEDLDVIE